MPSNSDDSKNPSSREPGKGRVVEDDNIRRVWGENSRSVKLSLMKSGIFQSFGPTEERRNMAKEVVDDELTEGAADSRSNPYDPGSK